MQPYWLPVHVCWAGLLLGFWNVQTMMSCIRSRQHPYPNRGSVRVPRAYGDQSIHARTPCLNHVSGSKSATSWGSDLLSIPSTLKAKQGKNVNPDLFRYLFAFIWRYQLPMEHDFGKALASIS